jgi:hypothetical protein
MRLPAASHGSCSTRRVASANVSAGVQQRRGAAVANAAPHRREVIEGAALSALLLLARPALADDEPATAAAVEAAEAADAPAPAAKPSTSGREVNAGGREHARPRAAARCARAPGRLPDTALDAAAMPPPVGLPQALLEANALRARGPRDIIPAPAPLRPPAPRPPLPPPLRATQVFLEVKVEGQSLGRITIELLPGAAPVGAARFADLAVGKQGVGYRLAR